MSDALDRAEPRPRPKHKLLVRILRNRGWNQADLARAARVDQNVVSRLILLKFRLVRPSQVAAIAAVCGVHPTQLVPLKPRTTPYSARSHAEHERSFSSIAAAGERVPELTYFPDAEANVHLVEEEIRMALRCSGLTAREVLVLTRLYGLDANPVPVSAETVAARLKISVARVNQIRQRAFSKMRPVISTMRGQLSEHPPTP